MNNPLVCDQVVDNENILILLDNPRKHDQFFRSYDTSLRHVWKHSSFLIVDKVAVNDIEPSLEVSYHQK